MKHENVLVSVVMPAYNDEPFIFDAISSVLNQTHRNLELIVVEDCSLDKTLNVINSFHDDRIRLFANKNNRGAAYSRNLAIKESKGEYIAFLDGDDLWEKDKIEKQLDFMISNSYGFSYSNYREINNSGETTNIFYTGPKKINHRGFMRMNYVGCLTVMYKKSVYPDLSIPNDIVRRNDYALWLKLSEKSNCYLLDCVLANYRRRDTGSITTSNKNNPYIYHKKLFKELYGYNGFKCCLIFMRGVFYSIVKKIIWRKKYD